MRSSDMSYSKARFCVSRNLSKVENFSSLLRGISLELSSLAHSFLVAGRFLSMMLTEVVMVISASKPSLFRSRYPSSTIPTNSTYHIMFSPPCFGFPMDLLIG